MCAHLSKNLRGCPMEGACCRGWLMTAEPPAGGHRMTTDITSSASIPVAASMPVKLRGNQRKPAGCGSSSEDTGGSDTCACSGSLELQEGISSASLVTILVSAANSCTASCPSISLLPGQGMILRDSVLK